MRPIAVIDSETDPFKKGRIPAPFLWGYYDNETYEEFEKEIDLITFLYDKNIIVYAHNGGKFDYHFLFDFIDLFTEIMIINGRIAKFKIGECEFRDSYNILPTSLSLYQKTKINYDRFEKEERDKPHNKKAISSYLYDDCRFLFDYVSTFINRYGMSLTLAGAAMKQWKQISGLEPPEDRGGIIYEKFKKFYYGGRCQTFEYGVIIDDFEMVDINSAYSYAMLFKHPLYTNHIDITGDDWHDLGLENQGPAFLTIKAVSKGALPFRGNDGSLYFPDDNTRRKYNITGWELLAAIDTGTISDYEILEGFYFTQQADFSEYINHFYAAKKEAKETGDKAGYIFAKLFQNTLYGKFGSNPGDYHSYMTADPRLVDKDAKMEDKENGDWYFSGEFGPWALMAKELDDNEQHFYNVACAASITGFVRAYLWRAICVCDGVLYCDTDSIAARRVKSLPNGIGKELGQWDKEGEFSGGAFSGRKLYAMAYKVQDESTKSQIEGTPQGNGKFSKYAKSKHWKMNARELRKEESPDFKLACKGVDLSPKQMFDIAQGETVLYEPENPVFSVHKEPHFINRRVKMVKKTLPVEEV